MDDFRPQVRAEVKMSQWPPVAFSAPRAVGRSFESRASLVIRSRRAPAFRAFVLAQSMHAAGIRT